MSNFHHENKMQFVEAVRETARQSGFSESLIEEDYYCSLILKEIFRSKDCFLIFKGGTLLNKCYIGFYRLSEDLDFSISNRIKEDSRKGRSLAAQTTKKVIGEAVSSLSLVVSKSFAGHNENRFYSAEITYDSSVTEDKNTIKIEFGIQEKIWERENLKAKTLLVNPFTQKPVVSEFYVEGLSLKEAYSEKIRAALFREKPAIRDIFDIHYAVKRDFIKTHDISSMVKYKMKVLNRTVDLSNKKKEELLNRLQTDLKPVLRQDDFEKFDFEEAWNWLKTLEKEISQSL